MKLTDKNKKYIDSLSLYSLLEGWRNTPVGSEWFQDETGEYWQRRMCALRDQDNAAWVAASKAIGHGGDRE